tara:strand:+ start:461 stop:694 length:234 start_codon:yes stop_codon:yes gene_type:complete
MINTDISKKDQSFIDMAYNHALKSDMLFQHGCVCTINGKVVSMGYNNYRTRCRTGLVDSCSTHAEMDAIRKLLIKVA